MPDGQGAGSPDYPSASMRTGQAGKKRSEDQGLLRLGSQEGSAHRFGPINDDLTVVEGYHAIRREDLTLDFEWCFTYQTHLWVERVDLRRVGIGDQVI